MIADNIVLIILIVGLIVWAVAATYFALHRTEPMEDLHLTDHYVLDDEVEEWLEQAGFEIIGGKYYIPLHIQLDAHEEVVSRIWVDSMVRRDEEWYPVRLVRERMELDWNAAGIRKLWSVYQLAFPDAAGIVIVDQADRSIKVIQMQVGDPVDAIET